MYNGLRRRGGSSELAGPHARQAPADAHAGVHRDFLARHEGECAEVARADRRTRKGFAGRLFRRATDHRNLMCAIEHLDRRGGRGPGPDGIKIDDLDHGERHDLARNLRAALTAGTYRTGPDREKRLAKTSGQGHRTLRIQDLQDRVAQRAIVQAIQPFLDPTFARTSFGYRPRIGREHALATALHLASRRGLWVWAADDIRDAFDHVPHGRLMDVVARHLGEGKMADLIRVAIENERGKGLRQGGSLSPLLLNLYLDHVLDRPWARERPSTPLLRYADDLLILAANAREAEGAHAHMRDRLRSAGMHLKGQGTTGHDLRTGQPVEWIGFEIAWKRGRFIIRPSERNWWRLEDELEAAHEGPDAPIRAIETIEGWLGQMGPCAADIDIAEVHARIAAIATELSFEEIPDVERVARILGDALRRWEEILRETGERMAEEDDGGSAKPTSSDRNAVTSTGRDAPDGVPTRSQQRPGPSGHDCGITPPIAAGEETVPTCPVLECPGPPASPGRDIANPPSPRDPAARPQAARDTAAAASIPPRCGSSAGAAPTSRRPTVLVRAITPRGTSRFAGPAIAQILIGLRKRASGTATFDAPDGGGARVGGRLAAGSRDRSARSGEDARAPPAGIGPGIEGDQPTQSASAKGVRMMLPPPHAGRGGWGMSPPPPLHVGRVGHPARPRRTRAPPHDGRRAARRPGCRGRRPAATRRPPAPRVRRHRNERPDDRQRCRCGRGRSGSLISSSPMPRRRGWSSIGRPSRHRARPSPSAPDRRTVGAASSLSDPER
ncbi:Group II intron-encoded protein LtrA [Aquisphaera giovannonii]|uniref:Group II intron-encoded protein LtrA n=1 Tax=Aquisphaera giovannonii TaxID=406548 RepID=A0A5B9VVL4_9BACT|nr:reverse transcriptase domain-containing protein [Aquisphaera giovannonii]QEH32114.1 Group II intron-encoded protein LtrA [Aquisphaera giovannonii]